MILMSQYKNRINYFTSDVNGKVNTNYNPYYETQLNTMSKQNEYKIKRFPYAIYGFRIKKSEPDPTLRVEYTNMAENFIPIQVNETSFNLNSWKETFIINSFKPCMLKFDGTVDYYLNPFDQTLKMDGTLSDVANINYNGNAMVEIKKMYLYCYEDSTYEYCNIANYKVNNNYKCYAHVNSLGQEVDCIYLPMFKGSLDSSNRLRSIANQTPIGNSTTTEEITYAKNNGSRWYTDDFINHKLIQNIAYLISKSCDTQNIFGNGNVSNSKPNITGNLASKSMFYGTKTDKTSSVKLLFLENYYGDRYDRTAGLINYYGTYYVKPHPPYNENDSVSGYINTGILSPSTFGFQNQCTMTEYGLLPTEVNGTETTYYTDGLWCNRDGIYYPSSGGAYGNDTWCGLAYMAIDNSLNVTDLNRGASICYK